MSGCAAEAGALAGVAPSVGTGRQCGGRQCGGARARAGSACARGRALVWVGRAGRDGAARQLGGRVLAGTRCCLKRSPFGRAGAMRIVESRCIVPVRALRYLKTWR